MGFKLIRVDAAEPYKITLHLGSHLIGRGKLLDCNDNRVSRNHAELIVTSDSILLKSLHQNPCFVKKKSSAETSIITQPESQVLTNGDQFGLIPETFWYEVIGTLEETPNPSIDNQVVGNKSGKDQLNQDATQNGGDTQIYKEEAADNDDDQSCSQSVLGEVFDAPFDLKNQTSSIEAQDISNNQQEVLETMDTTPPVQAVAAQLEVPTNLASQPDQTETNNQTDSPSKRLSFENDSAPLSQNIEPTKSPVQSDQSGSNNETSNPGQLQFDENSPTLDQAVVTNQTSESGETTDNQHVTKRLHSEDESTFDVKRIKTEPETPKKDSDKVSGNNAGTSSVKQEPASPQDVKPGPSNVQGPGPSGPDSPPARAPPSPTKPPNKPLRERCWYGANCYRKNPQHLAQFSHPRDADWGPGAKAPCPWGAACQRHDPRHWRDHEHPPGAQPQRAPRGPRLGMRSFHRGGNNMYLYGDNIVINLYEDHFRLEDSDDDSVDFDYEF